MTLNDEIRDILNSDGPVDAELLQQLREKYPFFTLPATLQIKENAELTDEERNALLQQLAMNSADSNAVAAVANPETSAAEFYPAEKPEEGISTDKAITKFLDTFGTNDPHEEEVLTQLIFNPTPDYAQLLAREEEKNVPSDNADDNSDEQDRRINKFIRDSREQGGHFPTEEAKKQPKHDNASVSDPDTVDHSMLTESLAKSYVRQKKYSKALEIITHLSLNYPEKSIYFADQMRFLRKVVLIEQYKNKQ